MYIITCLKSKTKNYEKITACVDYENLFDVCYIFDNSEDIKYFEISENCDRLKKVDFQFKLNKHVDSIYQEYIKNKETK